MGENDGILDEGRIEEEIVTTPVKYNGIELYSVVSHKTRSGNWVSKLEFVISDTELDDLVRDLPFLVTKPSFLALSATLCVEEQSVK